MRKFYYLLILTLFFGVSSCDDQTAQDDLNSVDLNSKSSAIAATKQFVALTNDVSIKYCGSSSYTFWAGQTINAGTVVVGNDDNHLYVTVTSTAGFQNVQENLKMWVGTNLADMPQNNQGVPTNGQFPYKAAVSGNTFTFKILLSDIFGEGDYCPLDLYVVVHGDVLVNVNGQTSAQTAYGGDNKGTSNRWWYYIDQTTSCCDDETLNAWMYKEGSPGRITCFEIDEVSGFSNRMPFGGYYKRTEGFTYPIYAEVIKENCDLIDFERIGTITVYLLDYLDEENVRIKLKLQMYEGYSAKDWSVYVGWKNPIVASSFDPALISNIDVIQVNNTQAEYILFVKDWPGISDREADVNGLYQFYLTSRTTYIKE